MKLNFGFKPKLIRTIQLETGLQALEYTTTDSKISKTKKQEALEAIQLVVCEFSCLGHASQVRSLKLEFYLWFETEFETELNLNSSLKPDFVDWITVWFERKV